MTPSRTLAYLALPLALLVPPPAAGQGPDARDAAQSTLVMTKQGELSAKERADLDAKLAALYEQRRKEKVADAKDMLEKREASSFEKLKGEFREVENGLLIRDPVIGEGPEVGWGDRVELRAACWTFDGEEHAASGTRGETRTIRRVGQNQGIVAAWNQALIGMREGGRRLVATPSYMAHGRLGSLHGIPPNAHLLYELEVVEVETKPRRPDFGALKARTTDSGLQWARLAEGEGEVLRAGDEALVHYSGWVAAQDTPASFGSSFEIDRPLYVPEVGGDELIPGFSEALVGMREGERRALRIPAELGYGEQPPGGMVPKNAELLYVIEALQRVPPRPELEGLKLTTQPSGLRWADLKPGSGPAASEGDAVVLHFQGWLADGGRFDTTWPRALPMETQVGSEAFPAGWNEGLLGVRTGTRRVVVVPPELGFGEEGLGDAIPGGATLVLLFDVAEVRPAAAPSN